MLLKELLRDVETVYLPDELGGTETDGLTEDSRRVSPGCVFVCQTGKSFDGHDFAPKALAAGAAVVVTGRKLGLEREVVVRDPRAAYARMCSNKYGRPEDSLKIIGVTGTNGKSSSTHFIYELLTAMGEKAALIGTLGAKTPERFIPTNNTTPECLELEALLRELVDGGTEYVVMEVSSQGLALDRVYTFRFTAAAFTNLTRDHLDFHDTFENYAASKAKLFAQSGVSVVNIDDSYGEYMLSACTGRGLTMSAAGKDADFSAQDVSVGAEGIAYTFVGEGCRFPVKMPLFGMFSVYNTLTALSVLTAAGFDPDELAKHLGSVEPVRGRMEPVKTGLPFGVFIDYAHSPDALENVLTALREVCTGRIITVFGCGGDRDATKRPIMGATAGRLSDLCVVTSDNPRTEDPDGIIADITAGMDGCSFITVTERRDAIEAALREAKPGDAVLLAGKGHEDYIIKGHTKFHF
nr:UDP-N-acetylmuramoyl-L-alanyl-D-glutamate--2,6-diaminopimelate ligase [Clostridia bacterium]